MGNLEPGRVRLDFTVDPVTLARVKIIARNRGVSIEDVCANALALVSERGAREKRLLARREDEN